MAGTFTVALGIKPGEFMDTVVTRPEK